MVLIEFAFLHLGVEPVVPEDLQDGADVLDMEGGVLGEDDDIVEDADRRQIQVCT